MVPKTKEWSLKQECIYKVAWALAQDGTNINVITLSSELIGSIFLDTTYPKSETRILGQLAYLIYSNEKSVPYCQCITAKCLVFHIYWGLIKCNEFYKKEWQQYLTCSIASESIKILAIFNSELLQFSSQIYYLFSKGKKVSNRQMLLFIKK